MQRIKKLIVSAVTSLSTVVLMASPAAAATVVVYGDNLAGSGWAASTTTGGTVTFESAGDAPLGNGVAKLTTINDNDSRARLTTNNHSGTVLSSVNELGYSSKVDTASCDCGSVSMFITIDLDGDLTTTNDRTSLVHEPYWQNGGVPDPDPVVQDVWQTWDVDQGIFWSSNTVGSFVAGAGGPPFYTLAEAKIAAPTAVVTATGVYIGSFNPAYITYADAVIFNGTTYDFEVTQPVVTPTNKDQCKKDGWKSFGGVFKNQGDCVSWVATNGRNPATGLANF